LRNVQDYYFTPIYDPRTRRSRLPLGRTNFPRVGQVKGYLTHSNLFEQSDVRMPWRLKQTLAAEDIQYTENGYELRPIGWQPGTGYRDESYPSGEIYRTYDEAVEWIRNQERETYQKSLDVLLKSVKLYVYDIEYSGRIADHPDWMFPGPGAVNGRMPSQFGHHEYHLYPGWRWSPELREYVSEPIPDLPSEVLMQLNPGDSGIRTRNAFELGGMDYIIQNYLILWALVVEVMNSLHESKKLWMFFSKRRFPKSLLSKLHSKQEALPLLSSGEWLIIIGSMI